MLKSQLKIFFTALMFYTRIPCPKWTGHEPTMLNKATRYFPLIGWIVGAISYTIYFLSSLIFPVEIAVLLSMIGGILTTGAFHEDGFADVCDGFGGGWTQEKILTIMKDSRVGAFGAMGIFLMLLLKFYLLVHLVQISHKLNVDSANVVASHFNFTLGMIFMGAHSISRLMAISLIFTHQYVRDENIQLTGNQNKTLAKPIAQDFSWKEILGSLIFGITPCIYLITQKISLVLLLIPLLLTRFYLASYFKKWIGGYTGDCLGATQQVTEVMFYLSLLGLCKFI